MTGTTNSYSINGPIGVFDSGYGGLSILKDLIERLPQNDFIYIGDNARNPYGPRSYDIVYRYTHEAVSRLFEMGCPLVIIACNTASAKALRTIQQKDLPVMDASRRVLGVIRPSVEAVRSYTKSGHVGVLATQGAVASLSYPMEISKLYPEIIVTQEACPMWVPLVEYNEYDSGGADYFVKTNIENLLAKDPEIDCVILGCTHYPLLHKKIRLYMPDRIRLLYQGPVVAASFEDYLLRHPEMNKRLTLNGDVSYFSSESPEAFSLQGSHFMERPVNAQHIELSLEWKR
jgi:glutamate racemase